MNASTTSRSEIHTHHMFVYDKPVRMTTSAIMNAYSTGATITLFDRGDMTYHRGHIFSIRNESGCGPNQVPRHLLITICEQWGYRVSREFYVYTAG
jgi:hypothetical protein